MRAAISGRRRHTLGSLFKSARLAAVGTISQEDLAARVTSYLRWADEQGRSWARGGSSATVSRHFIGRLETGGQNPLASPGSRMLSRAIAEYLGLEWVEVLAVAGIVSRTDIGKEETRAT